MNNVPSKTVLSRPPVEQNTDDSRYFRLLESQISELKKKVKILEDKLGDS